MDRGVRLHRGDNLEMLRAIPDGAAAAVITDPPYGINKADWDGEGLSDAVLDECFRICDGYCLFFYSNTALGNLLGRVKERGRDAWTLVWHRNNAMSLERRFAAQWTPIVCAFNGGLPFWGPDYFPCPLRRQDTIHPTPKPLEVMRWLVERACPRGGLVVDPYMGSGTTGVACVELGRRFAGAEINPDYYHEAAGRIARAVPRPPAMTSPRIERRRMLP